MAYCTEADVRLRLPGLGTDEATSAIVAAGIAAAGNEINSVLCSRFAVPFAPPVPGIIADISADLAAAWVCASSFSGGGENKQTNLSEFLRKRAQELLADISSGELQIVGEDGPIDTAVSPGLWSTTYGTRGALSRPDWMYGPEVP